MERKSRSGRAPALPLREGWCRLDRRNTERADPKGTIYPQAPNGEGLAIVIRHTVDLLAQILHRALHHTHEGERVDGEIESSVGANLGARVVAVALVLRKAVTIVVDRQRILGGATRECESGTRSSAAGAEEHPSEIRLSIRYGRLVLDLGLRLFEQIGQASIVFAGIQFHGAVPTKQLLQTLLRRVGIIQPQVRKSEIDVCLGKELQIAGRGGAGR